MSEGAILQRGYRVTGRVQGVFFRAWTREMALELGVRGAVRNLPDGQVEAHAAGPVNLLEEFEKRLWVGPSASRVDGVEEVPSPAELPEDTFEILY